MLIIQVSLVPAGGTLKIIELGFAAGTMKPLAYILDTISLILQHYSRLGTKYQTSYMQKLYH